MEDALNMSPLGIIRSKGVGEENKGYIERIKKTQDNPAFSPSSLLDNSSSSDSTTTEGSADNKRLTTETEEITSTITPPTSPSMSLPISSSPIQMPQTPIGIEDNETSELSIITETDSIASSSQQDQDQQEQEQPKQFLSAGDRPNQAPNPSTSTQQPTIFKSKSHVFTHRFQSTPVFQHRNSTSNILSFEANGTSDKSVNNRSSLALSSTRSRQSFKRKNSSIQTLTRSQKEKMFDDDSDDINDDNDDAIIYNVPIASKSTLRIFESNNNTSKTNNAFKKIWNQSDSNLIIPPSPLPGKLPESLIPNPKIESPALKTFSSFSFLSPEAKQISTFYEYTSQSDAKEEIRRRTISNDILNNLAKESMDDLTLASKEKIDNLTITRPTWYPPKSSSESIKHEQQYRKMIKSKSKLALLESKKREQKNAERLIGDERLGYLTSKVSLSSKNINEIKRYIHGSKVTNQTKILLLRLAMKFKFGYNDEEYRKVFSTSKAPHNSSDELSQREESPHSIFDESLISSGYTSKEASELIRWLKYILNSEEFQNKLIKQLKSTKIQYLLHNFNDDLALLNFKNCILLISKLAGNSPNEIMAVIELIISYWCHDVAKSVRLLLSICVCIIKDYHFGWSNLQMLILNDDVSVYIGDSERGHERFWEKVFSYYYKL